MKLYKHNSSRNSVSEISSWVFTPHPLTPNILNAGCPHPASIKLVFCNYKKINLKKVEKVTIEVAREVMNEVPGGVPEFEPFIRYHTFADFSINFTVILRAKEFVDQYLIKHEFIKCLHERYAKEGIVIPYPIRAINYEQEKTE